MQTEACVAHPELTFPLLQLPCSLVLPRLCLASRLLQLLILSGSRGVSPCSLHGTFMLVLVHVLLLAFALPHLDSFPH